MIGNRKEIFELNSRRPITIMVVNSVRRLLREDLINVFSIPQEMLDDIEVSVT